MNFLRAGRRRLLVSLFMLALLWLSVLAAFQRADRAVAPHDGNFGRPEFVGITGLAPTRSELRHPVAAGTTGINLDEAELADPQLFSRLDRLAAGVRWVRFTLPWDVVEPTQEQFDWARWDAFFTALAARPQLIPVVVLDRSPAWARSETDTANPQAPPHERRDFGAFAAAVATRYGDQVRYYQVWHEPNIAPHWGAQPASPADYLGLLREAAVQLRAADPDAQIVLAALAPTTEAGGANLSDLDYLDGLYRLGGRAWFDVVAGQPYGFSAPPDAAAAPETLNFGRISLLRAVMLRHDDGGAPLWATAFGWNALPPGWAGPDSPWGQVSEAEQTRYAEAALTQARARWSWLGPLFWPALCPGRPADDPWLGFALCAEDGAARPVARALVAASTAPAVLAPGLYAPDHPALRYDPGWRVTPSAADPSADGDAVTFDFLGTSLALRVQGGPYWAYYRITIDGMPANALPRDETGAAYLVLHDPTAATRWVTVAQELPPGQHAVRLEAVGGWGQWALQGIAVTDGTGSRPLLLWVLVVLAALATVAWAAGVMAYWLQAGQGLRNPRTGTSEHANLLEALRVPSCSFVEELVARLPEWSVWGVASLLVAALVLSRWFVLDLAALAGLGLLFIVRPDLSLPLIAAALPFWQQPKRLVGWEFGHFELFLWVAVLALGARWALQAAGVRGQGSDGRGQVLGDQGQGAGDRGQAPESSRLSAVGHPPSAVRHSPFVILDYPILALLLSGLASTLLAAEQGVAWREFRIVFLFGAAFYWLITRVPWPAGRSFSWQPLVAGLLAGQAAASVIALGQLVTGQGRIYVEGVWRVAALYGSPNNLALVLERGVPLALVLAAFALTPGRGGAGERGSSGAGARGSRGAGERGSGGAGEQGSRGAGGLLCALAASVMLIACIATFSKGALLLGLPVGIAVVLIGGAWRSGRRWPLWALVGLIGLGAVGLALLFRTPRFADLFNFQSGTSFVRLKLWQGAWQMALDHPILGVGPDNFLYAYRTTYVLPSAWQELNLSHPHNILLDLWTRLGLVGVIVGGWALLAAFLAAWRAFRVGNAETWPLALGLLAGLAATVAHGLIDNSLFLPDLMGLFVVAVGLLRRFEG